MMSSRKNEIKSEQTIVATVKVIPRTVKIVVTIAEEANAEIALAIE